MASPQAYEAVALFSPFSAGRFNHGPAHDIFSGLSAEVKILGQASPSAEPSFFADPVADGPSSAGVGSKGGMDLDGAWANVSVAIGRLRPLIFPPPRLDADGHMGS